MSNAKTLHLQFADGEIEVGTLIDALYEQERTIAILRQHKNDYMEAAEGTRKARVADLEAKAAPMSERAAFEAYCQSIGFTLKTRDSGDYVYGYGAELWCGFKAGFKAGFAAAPQPHPVVSQKMIAAAEEAYMPFGDMGFALTAALAAMDYDGAEQ